MEHSKSVYIPLLDAVKSSSLLSFNLDFPISGAADLRVRMVRVVVVVVAAAGVRIVRKGERPIHLENVF